MTINYKWSISNLYTSFAIAKFPNAVMVATWQLTATDNNKIASVSGSVDFSIDKNQHFIPYKSLTEDMVIEWVKEILGAEAITAYENQLTDQLQESLPVSVIKSQELPWAK